MTKQGSVEAYKDLKQEAQAWFKELRDKICRSYEEIEEEAVKKHSPVLAGRDHAGKFKRHAWERQNGDTEHGGGGVMSVMRGRVFEKVGVNISTVEGEFSKEFAQRIPGAEKDPHFFATGISLVSHMCNPHVPAAHFNTRLIITTHGWFGGGGDITPMFPHSQESKDDAVLFHEIFKKACDKHNERYYPDFKKWCDEYFYLPHRKEPRGLGGIFYDQLNSGNAREDFAFTKDVGRAFWEAYPKIIRRRMMEKWSTKEREEQLVRRGRYVEFNLIYDRGTTFGLQTGGNTEAILMSMPPEAKWP